MESLPNLLDMDRKSMEDYVIAIGERPFRARQLLRSIYKHGITDFSEMGNLNKPLREKLATLALIAPPKIRSEQTSTDGTRKWLVEVDGKNSVETVFIPERNRGTLCVSSQVGCALGCLFCATAMQGFSRNLSTGEIIGQFLTAQQALGYNKDSRRKVSNVVMMGMGEPMLNFDNVIKAISLMTDDQAFGLSCRKVTLSTAGLVPAIDKLAEVASISLAVSLHAANNELRSKLMPINKKFPLEKLMAACKRYTRLQAKSKITFEYVMLSGINDSEADAYALLKLINGIRAKVNLIPFNSFPGIDFQCSSVVTIKKFRDILIKGGLVTVIRKTRGEDIAAACGQLAGKVGSRANIA